MSDERADTALSVLMARLSRMQREIDDAAGGTTIDPMGWLYSGNMLHRMLLEDAAVANAIEDALPRVRAAYVAQQRDAILARAKALDERADAARKDAEAIWRILGTEPQP